MTLLEKLRAATRQAHEETEQASGLSALLGDELRPAEYQRTLARLYRLHVALERKLVLDDRVPEALRQRDNLALLRQDLGEEPTDAPADTADGQAAAASPAASFARSLGTLYVLEGSALGGQVIGRHLRKFPELADQRHFFSRPADQVVGRWKTFCGFLASFDGQPEAFHDEVVRGALEAFTIGRGILENR